MERIEQFLIRVFCTLVFSSFAIVFDIRWVAHLLQAPLIEDLGFNAVVAMLHISMNVIVILFIKDIWKR